VDYFRIVHNPQTGVLGKRKAFDSANQRTAHFARGNDNRDDEKTVLNELVPIEACLNSSGAGTSLFWSSVMRYSRIL